MNNSKLNRKKLNKKYKNKLTNNSLSQKSRASNQGEKKKDEPSSSSMVSCLTENEQNEESQNILYEQIEESINNSILDGEDDKKVKSLNDLIKSLNQELENEKNEKEKYKLNCKKTYYEKVETLNMLKKCQNERDLARAELDSVKQMRLKENKRAKAEIDAVTREYCQIMSEKDIVHKEMEALQEKLNKSQDKVKQLNSAVGCFNSSSNYIDLHNNSNDLNATRISFCLNQENLMNKSRTNKMGVNESSLNSNSILDDLQIDTLKNQLKIVIKQRDEAYSQVCFIFVL